MYTMSPRSPPLLQFNPATGKVFELTTRKDNMIGAVLTRQGNNTDAFETILERMLKDARMQLVPQATVQFEDYVARVKRWLCRSM